MTLAYTPAYRLPYLALGAPASTTRAMTEQLAKALEAALLARGVTPPLPADWSTLTGRVTTLETDTGWMPVTTAAGFTYGAGFGPGSEGVSYRIKRGRVDLSMHMLRDTGTRTGDMVKLPDAASPGRINWYVATAGGQNVGEVTVRANGQLALTSSIRTDTGFVLSAGWPAV